MRSGGAKWGPALILSRRTMVPNMTTTGHERWQRHAVLLNIWWSSETFCWNCSASVCDCHVMFITQSQSDGQSCCPCTRVCRSGSKTDEPSGARKNATSRRSRTVSALNSTVSCNRLTVRCTRDTVTRTAPPATPGTRNWRVHSRPRRFHGVWVLPQQLQSVTFLHPWSLLRSRCALDLPPICPVCYSLTKTSAVADKLRVPHIIEKCRYA